MAETSTWKPIPINKFAEGISDSPVLGFADMRNVDVTTIPGEITLGFRSNAVSVPPDWSNVTATADAATDTFTVVSFPAGIISPSMPIKFDSIGTATGINTTDVYYFQQTSATTFQLYTNPRLNVADLVNITANGTVQFDTITFGEPLDSANFVSSEDPFTFILCTDGRVWWLDSTVLYHLGNTTLTSTGNESRGIQVWKNYILVFRRLAVDAFPISQVDSNGAYATAWTYAFQAVTDSDSNDRRPTLVGQDDIVYFANSKQTIGSIQEVAGDTFDPTDNTTWSYDAAALDIPTGLGIYELGEIGTYLLVGTSSRYIYPWDRVSPSFIDPLILPEFGTYRMESANNLTFIFAGTRGNIYVTNGSTIELYRKVPDSITGDYYPQITWGDACIMQNQLYFTFWASENGSSGSGLDSVAGAWAIDLNTKVLRHTNMPSYGDYSGETLLVIPNIIDTSPSGNGIFIAHNGGDTGNDGVDYIDSNLATNYKVRFDSPFMTVGTFKTPRTFKEIEVYFDRPLAATAGVTLYYRFGQNDAWTTIGAFEGTDANYLGRYGFDTPANIQDAVVLQLRVAMKGTDYFCVKEVRLD